MSRSLWKMMEESAKALQGEIGRSTLPPTLTVLGSGFKGFERTLEVTAEVELSELPHFPVPAVAGHGSALVIGKTASGDEVAVLTGRVHMYEGHSAADVVYPIRVLSTLGVQNVLLTNAAGSLQPDIKPGELVCLSDQINFTGRSCLINEAKELGPTFVDMTAAYDPEWRQALVDALGLRTGVYVGVLGPSYESPAETKMFGLWGGHVVGMSTVQEVLAARQLKMRVAGLSFVTNMAGGLGADVAHEDVVNLVAAHREQLHDHLTKAIAASAVGESQA